ncbi:MAG: tyrosine-type recombinase/integrase [Acidobacteria bacterium]|nr:tyrosine-type recombinase/integrase [Acidobacteriota bacterium]
MPRVCIPRRLTTWITPPARRAVAVHLDPVRESKLLRNVLQPAAKRAGLGRVTWHQFRHIHSSLLNDLRVPAKIAQEQLGHASIQTTLMPIDRAQLLDLLRHDGGRRRASR